MLIIDTNVLLAVFDPAHGRFDDYRPVHDFLYRRKGVVISGGSKYLAELGKLRVALSAITELYRRGQVRVISKKLVDLEEEKVLQLAPKPGCDDQHLIAMVRASGARVIASDDKRADVYLKDRGLYPVGLKRPSIYRRKDHYRLLIPLKTSK